MEPIRIGVIGVGQIGKHHLDEYERIHEANVVAVADINATELQSVANRYNVPHMYTNFRELLGRDDITAVDVCLHNNYHAQVSVAAMRAGKHVYCEKPIAGSFADARTMVSVAQETGRKLHIQLANLYARETRVAKRLIEDGRLGRLYHARSTGFRRRGRPFVDGYGAKAFVNKQTAGGGALFDMGVYHISQMLYLLNLPTVERISGKIYQETAMDERRNLESGYNVEELGMGFVRFGGGETLDVIESWAIHLNQFEGSYVVGSLGGVRLYPLSFHHTLGDMDIDAAFNLDADDFRRHALYENEDAYDSSERHWLAALQNRVDLLPTAELALQTMLISEGIYLSDRLGREVEASEVRENSHSTALDV